MVAVPITGFAPVAERAVFITREAFGTPGTIPASPGVVIPVKTFKPANKPDWLENDAWYGDGGDIYGILQGPLIGGADIGGDIMGDEFGHILYNIMGDYTTTGVAASPASTASALITQGSSTISVASGGASFTAGMALWIEDAGSPAANEVVVVASSTATTITLVSPTRFAHATAVPFTNTTGIFTHVFTKLNAATSIGNGAGQPPTHCFTDRTGLPATGFASQFGYSCFTEVTITGNSQQLLTWEGKTISNVRAVPGTPPVPNASQVQPFPGWRSTVKMSPTGGGALAQVNDFAEWMVTITREVEPYFTASGQQTAYIISRGKQGATGKLTVGPAIDDSSELYLLNNTQPQIQVAAGNGLTGTALISLQTDIGLGAYKAAEIASDRKLFGYENNYTAVHSNQTFNSVGLTGVSGGSGCVKFTLINSTPTY